MTDVYEPSPKSSTRNAENDHFESYQESIRSDAAFIDNASSFIKSTANLNDDTNLSVFSGRSSDNSHKNALEATADSTQYHVFSGLPDSRPLSRSSMTSGLSVTATKDGVEGKRVKKQGIPGYSLNLINKMYANYSAKQASQQSSGVPVSDSSHQLHLNTDTFSDDASSEITTGTHLSTDQADDGASVLSLSSMIPQYSREDTPAFNSGSHYQAMNSHNNADVTLQNDKEYHYSPSSEEMRRDDTLEMDHADDDYSKFLRKSVSEGHNVDL